MEDRKTIGERMLERWQSRERSHPAIDKKVSRFEDRFSRYGRIDHGSRLSLFLSPDTNLPPPNVSEFGTADASWLSAAPYWARLQRLGNARLRREQRLAAMTSRTQHRASISATRRLPDARPRGLPFLGLTGLVADQFEVLAPLPRPDELEAAAVQSGAAVTRDPSGPWQGAGLASSPWLSRAYTPATVSRAEKRPLERIQERAPVSRSSVEKARSSVERSIAVATSAPTVAAAQESKPSTAPEAPSRRIRRAMRGRSNPVRAVEYDYEAALPDDFLPPTRHAQGRLPAQRKGRRRGLRRAMSGSPLMAALEPRPAGGGNPEAVDPTAPISRRAQVSSPLGRSAARRTVHREASSQTSLLSASPIRRPALVAPSALTLARTEAVVDPAAEVATGMGMRHGLDSTESADSPVTPRKRRAAVAPTVRALSRGDSTPEPLIEQPLSERRPVASRPVRTRSGVYAPETQVLVPGAVPAEVTEDAAPEAAVNRARRSTATANAMERLAPGTQETRAVTESKATADLLRRNAPVKTPSGGYAPAAELLDGSGTDVLSSTQSSPPHAVSARDSVIERVGARKDSAESPVSAGDRRTRTLAGDTTGVAATQTRRLRPSTSIERSTLLASTAAQDSPQGQHAAGRADHPPTIGQSTTKIVRGFKTAAESPMEGSVSRRVAPRHFTSPLSHIRVSQAGRGTKVPQAGLAGQDRIVLRSVGSEQDPLSVRSSRRDAQEAAHDRVEEAWRTAGRPLDWTNARIDVIQVPVMVGATPEERDAPRTVRTQSGDYVPARTGRGRVSREVMSDPDAVTLARPDGEQLSEGVNDAGASSIDPTLPDAMPTPSERGPRAGAWRSGFDATIGRVGTGAVHGDMPIWAQRSTGRPRIKSGDDLVHQLAQAKAPADVVQVLMDQGNAARTATSSLPQPVIQVIQQIKTEASRAEEQVAREYAQQAEALPTETVRSRANRRGGVRSTTRVARGMTGLNPRGASGGQSSQAMTKVTQLAKRLQELIAMAESQNRSGARQQVRMAEDSGAAKAEGQAAPTSAESGRDTSADIDTLAREVTEQVTRELEMRRERRQEDPDGRSIWW